MMELPFAESYKIKMVEPIRKSTREEREQWIKEAHYNLFKLRSEQVFIDLLTDSGTGAMSDRQWSELMLGDESYAGSSSYYKLKDTIRDIFGFDYFLPTHQGRGAENVLFSVLIKPGDLVPGNAHFDTTKGHIEYRKAEAVDCTIDEAYDTTHEHPFKGNVDLQKLENVLKSHPREKIPVIIITATCNTSGGQPVSVANIKQVCALAKKYGIRVIVDSARFAENAFLVKQREPGYADKSLAHIVREMFSGVDGMTMSCKKDAFVNIGGFIALKDMEIFRQSSIFNIMFEGYITYGGMAGRDLNAIAQGLKESLDDDNMDSRIRQVAYLGQKIRDFGIPTQVPFGGHAIFVDAGKFLPQIPPGQYPAQVLAVELYIESGVRAVEIGTMMNDPDPVTKKDRIARLEMLRLAIPRRVYTNNHMDYLATALGNIFERRNKMTKGLKITYQAPILRHFTVELDWA
jgi:tryptophanase